MRSVPASVRCFRARKDGASLASFLAAGVRVSIWLLFTLPRVLLRRLRCCGYVVAAAKSVDRPARRGSDAVTALG